MLASENGYIKEGVGMSWRGISLRKPNKLFPSSNADIKSFSNKFSGGRLLFQLLVKGKGSPFNKEGINSPAGLNLGQEKVE
jgi:hypothetical protein